MAGKAEKMMRHFRITTSVEPIVDKLRNERNRDYMDKYFPRDLIRSSYQTYFAAYNGRGKSMTLVWQKCPYMVQDVFFISKSREPGDRIGEGERACRVGGVELSDLAIGNEIIATPRIEEACETYAASSCGAIVGVGKISKAQYDKAVEEARSDVCE